MTVCIFNQCHASVQGLPPGSHTRLVLDDSASPSRLLENVCGRIPSDKVITSSGGVMTLKFTSDISVTRKGFFGNFITSECNGRHTSSRV